MARHLQESITDICKIGGKIEFRGAYPPVGNDEALKVCVDDGVMSVEKLVPYDVIRTANVDVLGIEVDRIVSALMEAHGEV